MPNKKIHKIYLKIKHSIRNNLPWIMKIYKIKRRTKEQYQKFSMYFFPKSVKRVFFEKKDYRIYYLNEIESLYKSLERPNHYDKPWIPDTHSFRGIDGVIKIGQIEITNMCNLDCLVCKTKSAKRKPYIMPLDKFEHYVREAKRAGTYLIDLHCVGETFMHPEIEDIFKICHKHGIEIYKVSTNGQLVDKYIGTLFNYNHLFQTLRFSIDGGAKEVYEKVRRGASFERLISNLEKIHSEKQKRKKQIRIKINTIICADTLQDIPNCFRVYSKYLNHLDDLSFSLYEDVMLSEQEYNKENELFLRMPKISFCKQPWEWLNVLSDGSVSYCCHEFNWDTVVGNADKQSFREIWNGPEIKRHREMHLKREFPDNMFCKHCLDTRGFLKGLANTYIHFCLAFDPDLNEARYKKDFPNLLEDMASGRAEDKDYILKKYFY